MIISLEADQWIVVDDGVMGGRSRGHLIEADDGLAFHGTLNTRGGGFTSIRSRRLLHSLTDRAALVVRVKGDGRRYALDLRRTPRVSGREPTWKAPLPTRDGRWIEVVVPFADFVPTWRGRRVRVAAGARPFWHDVGSIGITIADGADGPFRLLLGGIDATPLP